MSDFGVCYTAHCEWTDPLIHQTRHDCLNCIKTGSTYRQIDQRGCQGYPHEVTHASARDQSSFGERSGGARKRDRGLAWEAIRRISVFDF